MHEPHAVALFLLITLPYLLLLLLTWFRGRGGMRLVAAGLLTAIAAMAYSSLVLPGGALLAGQFMKLGFILVLGGIGLQALNCREVVAPASAEEQHHD